MTQPPDNLQSNPGERIELEPPPSAVVSARGSPDASRPPVREPVPAKPLHLCPNCDYNLTGLIERRCPECGQPFDMADARFRGFELSEAGESLRRWNRRDWLKRGLGGGLIVLGFCCPSIVNAVLGPTRGLLSPVFRIWLLLFLICPGAISLALVCLYFDWGWTRTLLVVGVVTAVVGLLLSLL